MTARWLRRVEKRADALSSSAPDDASFTPDACRQCVSYCLRRVGSEGGESSGVDYESFVIAFFAMPPRWHVMVEDETCSVLESLALGVQLTMSRLGFGV